MNLSTLLSGSGNASNIKDFVKNDLKIGFVGAGNMARSLIKGILLKGDVKNDRIIVSAPSNRNKPVYDELGVAFTNDNQLVVNSSDLIFLAVKPHLLKSAVSKLQIPERKYFLSVAAGVTLKSHIDFGMPSSRFARMMPTVPVESGCGICCYCLPEETSEKFGKIIEEIFDEIAVCDRIADSQIDLIAALGSGTAFMCEAIQGLTCGIVKMGLPMHVASKLAPQVAFGTAKVIKDTGIHPAALADCIFSPGGMTISGYHALQRGGLKSAMMDAVETAVLQARKMSNDNK